jgi:hypothetical protein
MRLDSYVPLVCQEESLEYMTHTLINTCFMLLSRFVSDDVRPQHTSEESCTARASDASSIFHNVSRAVQMTATWPDQLFVTFSFSFS